MTKKKADWCSYVPDRWKDYDMSGCCMLHDGDYGTLKDRFEADLSFFRCLQRTAPGWIAMLYYVGVRLLGWGPWLKCWIISKVRG